MDKKLLKYSKFHDNKLKEFGVSPNDSSQLSENEIVEGSKQKHPQDGEVMNGHLQREGVKVCRKKLRECIHRVDHEAVVARRRKTIKRMLFGMLILIIS